MACCGINDEDAYQAIKLLLYSVNQVSEIILKEKASDSKDKVNGVSGVSGVNDSKDQLANTESLISGLAELSLLMSQGKLKSKEKNQVKSLVKLHSETVNDRIRFNHKDVEILNKANF